MPSYSYQKKSTPLVDENLKFLLNNPQTFAGQVEVGEQLCFEYFFEVIDSNGNLLGFIWFNFYSDENMIEISLGKSPQAKQFQGFAENIFSDLDKIKTELPQEWLNDSKWLGVVKKLNPKKEKLEKLLTSNNFQKDEEDGFIKAI